MRCIVEKPPLHYDRVAEVAIYRLLEDTNESDDLICKKGDVLIGGGSGEWGFFRISYPFGIRFALGLNNAIEKDRKKLYAAEWSWEVAYALCGGFEKVGWRYTDDIETWLAERVAAFAIHTYPKSFPDVEAPATFLDWHSVTRADFEAYD